MARKRVKVPVYTEEEKAADTRETPAQAEVAEESPAAETAETPTAETEVVEEQAQESEAPATEEVDVAALLEEVKMLKEQLEAARAEAAEYKDRYLRAVAEMDNMRKRLEKRYADEAEQEKKRFLRSLLPLVDNLEMVLKHSDSDAEVLRQGVAMIVQELMRTLEREGVRPIKSVGERFDPFVHEAVEVVETDEYPPDTVVEEVQKGYTYKQDLLRPARVRVAGKASS